VSRLDSKAVRLRTSDMDSTLDTLILASLGWEGMILRAIIRCTISCSRYFEIYFRSEILFVVRQEKGVVGKQRKANPSLCA
jgi:hypothetical protein